jgi:hypothetical protein
MEDRILTRPPAGKQGVNITRPRDEAVRAAILDSIRARGGQIPFGDLPDAVGRLLPADFDGSVGWYTTTVKLDLEARGEIVRVAGRTPQEIRLA